MAVDGEWSYGSADAIYRTAIEVCLTLKGVFGLALGQVTGLVASLLKLAKLDWPVPDYTTLYRRQKTLAVQFAVAPVKPRHRGER